MLSIDVILESFRAIIVLILGGYLWRFGRNNNFIQTSGWRFIQLGFLLILFGSFLDITDNFESLNRFVVVGDTPTEYFLEKVVGYLAGVVFLTIGLIRWGPSVEQLVGQIAERKKAEEELQKISKELEQKVEKRFKGLAEVSSDWFWEMGSDLRFTYFSPRNKEITGFNPELYIGKTRREVRFGLPEDEDWQQHLADIVSHTKFRDFEYDLKTADGAVLPISISGNPIFDDEGTFKGFYGTGRDISNRKQAEQQLLEQATIDQVTGLPNRALLFDRLAQATQHARLEKRNIGLIFVDLDRFKQINDTRGHAAGDRLLKEIGNRLSTLVRHEDIVARLGGDEFIILLHDVEMPNGPETVANKIIDSFVSPFDIEGRETFITASLGISIFPNDGEEAETLLQNADAAMYKSKEQGRNTFRFFTPGLNDQAVQHSRIAERLRHALDRGDFELYFQPVVDILKDKVVSIEALIRWDDAVLKAVDPEQLISVAEETGFILPIDEWVLDEACRHVASWRADVAPSLQLNVNISSSHFRNAYLVEVVKLALEKSHLPAQALTIEITENVLIGETPEILQRLNKLTDIGVKLTLDDFGTGYSSLGCLKRFKVNGLKIDRSFIRDIPEVPGDLALIEAIIAMSNSLGLSVIAEGVEKPEQLELLRKRGCHLIQGFHFSEPLSVDEMTNYLSVEIKS
jgi:diguanylate cyclase (GGDEF)-like protein/PAS domain S-box-containing protein